MNKLFIAIAQLLYGTSWQASLHWDLGVADRTIRRWAAGSEPIPIGVWNDFKNRLYNRNVDVGRMHDRIVGLLGYDAEKMLKPIPNEPPVPAINGVYVYLQRPDGKSIMCWVRRGFFDDAGLDLDHKQREVLQWFMDRSESFYRAANTKFKLGEYDEAEGIWLDPGDVIVQQNLNW
jgi:hypothetical protein